MGQPEKLQKRRPWAIAPIRRRFAAFISAMNGAALPPGGAGIPGATMQVIKSEVGGTVWKIDVSPGQAVGVGDVLMILESMKMEIPVEAPVAGRVGEIMVAEGDPVREDQPLLRLDGADR
jgi:acetyl-CoA carboxylase biotin carboxyl carrier protein